MRQRITRTYSAARKTLITAVFLATLYTGIAQPAGYEEGTLVCWNFNGRDHQYFRAVNWNYETDHTLIFFGGDYDTTCASMLQHVVASLLDSNGTGWNGVTTLPGGSSRKWQVLILRGALGDYYLPPYADDISYFYSNTGSTDTANHQLHHMAALTGGIGRALGFLMNDQTTNSPYQRIFSTGIWMSPPWIGDLNLLALPVNRNYVWFGTADSNPNTPPAAAFNLYNRLPGTGNTDKFIDSTVGGTHDNSTWGDCMKLTGTTNRWTWMLEGNNPPVADAGINQSILLPASSVTLMGGGIDMDGTIVSYEWNKTQGGAAAIVNPTSASTSVNSLTRGVYTFQLIVTDNSGLKDTAYTSVAVTPESYSLGMETIRMIPITPWREAENLVDGNLNTTVCNTFINAAYAIPQEFLYVLGNAGNDSTYDNLKIRLYNGGSAGGIPVTAWLMADNFADSMIVTGYETTFQSWAYLDSNITKFAPWPVRYIKFKINACAGALGEMQVYGSAAAPAASFFAAQNFTPATPSFTSYFGANVNGDEPDSLWNAFSTVRYNTNNWYFDTATAGITPSTHKYIFTRWGDAIPDWTFKKTQFGLNRDMWFYTIGTSAANMPEPRPYAPDTPNQYGYYAEFNYWKDISPGSDSTNPASWINEARLGYATAALFGNNPSASLTGYDITASNTSTGQNLFRGIEFGNERNATWAGPTGYSSPQVKAANLSAAYDGHMGTMGTTLGVKNADPNFKVYAGALINLDTSYLKALAYWVNRYRGAGNVPFDILCVNTYCTDGGGQHSGTQGITPEQFMTVEKWQQFIGVAHRMFGNIEVRWSEFGWDSNPHTIYSAKAHGSKDAQEVKADRIIRAYHLGRLAHLHGADQYRTRDEGGQENTVGFVTSGQFSGYPYFIRWKTSYWMSTTLDVLKGYNAWPTLIENGDSTGIWVLRDDPVNGNDTTVYTLFRGTNDDSYQTYMLSLNANAEWAERVDMDTVKTGIRTPLMISGNSITLGNIGESPVYVRVKYGSSESLNNAVLVNAFPNPVARMVTVNLFQKPGSSNRFSTAGRVKTRRANTTTVYIKRISIYNSQGMLIKAVQPGNQHTTLLNIPVEGQPAGIYHFVIVTNTGTVTKKIEVIR